MKKYFTLPSIFCFLLACTFQVQAQDPCIEGGYELSFAVVDIDCKGDNSGEVTVNSTGCECFFSDCSMAWFDIEGNEVANPQLHTVTELSAGEYTVVVTHPDGCVLEGTVEVKENESFIQEVIVDPIKCNGETNASIEIVQAELTGALAITWNTGDENEYVLENLAPGVYEFTAENYLGCQETHSFEIEEPAVLDFETETKASCEGIGNGEINIIPEGGSAPYVVFINSELPTENLNFSNLNPGTHNLMIVDVNNCQVSKSVEITEEFIPVPEVSMSIDEICQGASAQLEAIINDIDCTYSWTPTEGLNDPTSATVEASPLETTTYTVVATSPNGCQSSYDVTLKVLECASGINDVFQDLTVYPNPSTGFFNLRYEEQLSEVAVYDVVGRKIQSFEQSFNQEKVEFIDITDQIEGIYFLVLTNNDGAQRTIKITKE